MGHLDSLRILHRMEGRQFPQGNELTCLGPFHRKLEGIVSVAELEAQELEDKELGWDLGCLGGLCSSCGPRFPHL